VDVGQHRYPASDTACLSASFRFAEGDWALSQEVRLDRHWKKLGDVYLLMQVSRLEFMGGDIIIGYGGRKSDACGVYGHKPLQKVYKTKNARDARRKR
jgi:hypothetical protein